MSEQRGGSWRNGGRSYGRGSTAEHGGGRGSRSSRGSYQRGGRGFGSNWNYGDGVNGDRVLVGDREHLASPTAAERSGSSRWGSDEDSTSSRGFGGAGSQMGDYRRCNWDSGRRDACVGGWGQSPIAEHGGANSGRSSSGGFSYGRASRGYGGGGRGGWSGPSENGYGGADSGRSSSGGFSYGRASRGYGGGGRGGRSGPSENGYGGSDSGRSSSGGFSYGRASRGYGCGGRGGRSGPSENGYGVASDGGRFCFICGNPGHLAKECNQRSEMDHRSSGRGGDAVHLLGGRHLAGDLQQRSVRGFRGGGGGDGLHSTGGRGRPSCSICGHWGHFATDCYDNANMVPNNGRGGRIGSDYPGHGEGGCHSITSMNFSRASKRGYSRGRGPHVSGSRGGRGSRGSTSVQPEQLSENSYQAVQRRYGSDTNGGPSSSNYLDPEPCATDCNQHSIGGSYSASGGSSSDNREPGLDRDQGENEGDDNDGSCEGNNNMETFVRTHCCVYFTESPKSLSNKSHEEKQVEFEKSNGSYVMEAAKEEDKRSEEEDDECCILDYNPYEQPAADLKDKNSLVTDHLFQSEDEDVYVTAARGQVACRDLPHSRHHCGNFPFSDTAHERCCPQCYCYVCEIVAPCKDWTGRFGHCHASDRDNIWFLRKIFHEFSLECQIGSDQGES